MSLWGKRSKVRLHSGGISPADVRLRRRGASEKATAPGRDIRDIGPDKGPHRCRLCSKPLQTAERARCAQCLSDEKLVRLVRKELARLGEPPLGTKVPPGSPWFRKRRRAEAAMARLAKLKKAAGRDSPRKKKPVKRTVTPTSSGPSPVLCASCFTELPVTRRCDTCTS